MTNQVTHPAQTPSIINDMAQRFAMDKRAFEATLKATVVPANITNEQFVAFLLVAKQYNLNPITKEIYAFPSQKGIVPIVSIDGWCNIINSNPQLDGIEFEDILGDDGKLAAIKCRISRKDRSKPTEAVEYMGECKRETQPWKQWPARMLRHKALIQCARYAFSLSGIVDPDEAERMVDITPETDPLTGAVSKGKSSFKTATERNKFTDDVQKMLKECKNHAEIDNVMQLHEERIDLMRNGDSRDELAVESIENVRLFCLKRLSDVTDVEEEPSEEEIAASYGADFASVR